MLRHSGGLRSGKLLKIGYLESGNRVWKWGSCKRHIPILHYTWVPPPPPPGAAAPLRPMGRTPMGLLQSANQHPSRKVYLNPDIETGTGKLLLWMWYPNFHTSITTIVMILFDNVVELVYCRLGLATHGLDYNTDNYPTIIRCNTSNRRNHSLQPSFLSPYLHSYFFLPPPCPCLLFIHDLLHLWPIPFDITLSLNLLDSYLSNYLLFCFYFCNLWLIFPHYILTWSSSLYQFHTSLTFELWPLALLNLSHVARANFSTSSL